jgi:hypothetical protein
VADRKTAPKHTKFKEDRIFRWRVWTRFSRLINSGAYTLSEESPRYPVQQRNTDPKSDAREGRFILNFWLVRIATKHGPRKAYLSALIQMYRKISGTVDAL